jgi:hypothetical protein
MPYFQASFQSRYQYVPWCFGFVVICRLDRNMYGSSSKHEIDYIFVSPINTENLCGAKKMPRLIFTEPINIRGRIFS